MGRDHGSAAAKGRPAVLASVVLAALLLSIGAAPPQKKPPAPKAKPAADLSLDEILARTAEYCRKLESSAFDFVCREEIKETIDPALEVETKTMRPTTDYNPKYTGPTIMLTTVRPKKVKRSFVYDYQCIRAGRTIREARTMLKENGKKKVVPNAELATSVVVFGNALLGPVGIFGERFRGSCEFTVAGEAKIGKTRVLVVDAKPRPGAPPTRNLYGKAWVDPATADILRIEWSENRVGHYDIFEERGKKFGRTPRLVIRSDFSAEKNGIRFPSRLNVEEAYLKESGKAFVRSTTEVVYTDFKFFTVDYDVRD
jgi:hypothetical protein